VAALGDLIYQRDGRLIAVPFDPERLETRGTPTTVAEGVADLPFVGVSYHSISVDPDGACQQIAIIDLAHNRTQQITFEWDNNTPLWTPDGSRLIFRSNVGGGARTLYWQAADGSGNAERLTASDRDQFPDSVSGRVLAFEELDPKTSTDLYTLSLDDRPTQVLLKTPFDEGAARFSPDGRFIAYQSNQSGRWEVYVQAYPWDGRRIQVSFDGGLHPIWMPRGHELAYLRGRDLMTVTLETAPGLRPAPSRRVSTLEPADTLLDVAADGRLLLLRRDSLPPATRLGLFLKWFEEVRRLTARADR
jgi:Tol biopolymer transport system component